MSFVSFQFIGFIIIVLSVFYLLKGKGRMYWLLASSYVFYGFYDVKLIAVLFAITILTWVGGKLIYSRKCREENTKNIFRLFFALDIMILVIYKYADFFLGTYNTIGRRVGLPESPLLNLIVPIGLSFIIFQSSSYLGDVNKGKIKPVPLASYALFAAFFPTLLSGPIQKSRDILPQFKFDKNPTFESFRDGMRLVVYGILVKLFVADKIGGFINPIYSEYQDYFGAHYFIAAMLFSIQIYADFSSYSDIARGTAKMIGIETRANFMQPYMSKDLVSFWKNWHMSLNSWFVEYIYIPLGGSRKGKLRKYINEMIVFLLSGLWHGAAWHFVLWGGFNGALQVVGEVTSDIRHRIRNKIGLTDEYRITSIIRMAIVYLIITGTWVFFKCGSVSMAVNMIVGIVKTNPLSFLTSDVYNAFGNVVVWITIIGYIFMFVFVQVMRRDRKILNIYEAQPVLIQYAILVVLLVCLIFGLFGTVAFPNKSFIYFEF